MKFAHYSAKVFFGLVASWSASAFGAPNLADVDGVERLPHAQYAASTCNAPNCEYKGVCIRESGQICLQGSAYKCFNGLWDGPWESESEKCRQKNGK